MTFNLEGVITGCHIIFIDLYDHCMGLTSSFFDLVVSNQNLTQQHIASGHTTEVGPSHIRAGPNIQKLKEAHFFHSIEIEVRYHKWVPLSEHQRPEEPENKKWRKSRQQWRPRGPLGFQAFLQGNPQKVRFLKPCTSFLWGFVCIFFFFPFGLGLCSRFCLFLLFLIPNCSHSFQIVNLDGVSWQ